MSQELSGWIHSFAVTDTQTHKNGYTIYKITSIVFPRALPQALTCITVWRRFHEIKRLHKEMSRLARRYLLGKLPEPTDCSFFKRFEESVIQRRKDYILKFLDFVAQHPPLFKSYAFTQFFNDISTPTTSPRPTISRHHPLTLNSLNDLKSAYQGAITDICHEIKSTSEAEVNDVDNKSSDTINENMEIMKNDNEIVESSNSIAEEHKENFLQKDYTRFLTPMASIESDDSDYIYEAALEFSYAVQSEANLNYQEAHRRYKQGVELLLNGCKDDGNDERKFIAKAKIAKYLARADEIYDQFLSNRENALIATHISNFELSTDVRISAANSALFLERPWNHLAKYKVLEVLNERVMKVQCITEPQNPIYIMKGVEKPSSNSPQQTVFLPQQVPYMVELLAFFQSEQKLFLLLKPAEGGRLYDYVKQYTPTREKIVTINELFPEIFETVSAADIDRNGHNNNIESDSEINQGYSEVVEALEVEESPASDAHNFNDIVRSSQLLLASVSTTLHKIQILDEHKIQEEIPNNSDLDMNLKRLKIIYHLPEACLKQWARELAVGIKSLHNKGVILGDLHMENLLLGPKGQLLLSYFYQNECAEIHDVQPVLKDYNQDALSGHFVAPDRPITCRSDWWSFGIILYQLIIGLPFKNMHPGHIELYGCVQYPEDIEISDCARDLLDNLLQQQPEERLNFEQMQKHMFFAGTDWDQVERVGLCNYK